MSKKTIYWIVGIFLVWRYILKDSPLTDWIKPRGAVVNN